MLWLKILTILLLAEGLTCANVTVDNSGLLTGVKVIYNTYQQCEVQDDLSGCLKFKLLKVLDRAIRADVIHILDGLSLIKVDEDGRDITNDMIEVDEGMLSDDSDERHREIDELLVDRAIRFFKSHSFQLNLQQVFSSAGQHFYDEFIEEGREIKKKKKKLKKIIGPLLAGFMMKSAIMMAMTYKGVSLLAGKAFLVAKMALVAAAINTLKKFDKNEHDTKSAPAEHSYPSTDDSYGGGGGDYGGGGGDYGGGGGDYGGGGGGGPYKRSVRKINTNIMRYNKRKTFS